MPSVAVVWKGNCRELSTRHRLLGHLHRLAQRSDEYLRLRQPERPRILDVLNEQRGRVVRLRNNIETIDQEISGTILISSFIGSDPVKLAAATRESGAEIVEGPEAKHGALIAISHAHLRGIDFKLFDPRGLYPGADRMSFVFLECPEHPVLDGRLVEIATSEELRTKPLHPYTQALFSAALPSHPDEQRDEIILTGEIPSPLNPPSGCRFHPRCPFAMPVCSTTEPLLQPAATDHEVACHLHT